ncbi:YebC/PmpR family DNA-binding transcriptional regulator [bacterium]|nr:YebC/PmpR family DNA-binding transcriptional regulator [bacterium]
MSGHSKWATIKRSKAATDAKRGKAFTKVTKEIIQAAKNGGGNPDMNARLRTAILAAKAVNMPHDNIKRAIMKGTGELAGESYDEIIYEGYGPGGVAVMIEITTDNKNRSASEIRSIFSKRNGNLGEPGSVSWMFEKKGQIVIKKASISEDDLMTLALEAGAEDITTEESTYTVTTNAKDYEAVDTALKDKVETVSTEVTMIPKNVITVDNTKTAESLLKLLETLEDHDDVQNVYSNFDIPDEIMESLRTEE